MISSTFLDVPHKDILLLLWWYHHLTVMIRKGMRTEIEHMSLANFLQGEGSYALEDC